MHTLSMGRTKSRKNRIHPHSHWHMSTNNGSIYSMFALIFTPSNIFCTNIYGSTHLNLPHQLHTYPFFERPCSSISNSTQYGWDEHKVQAAPCQTRLSHWQSILLDKSINPRGLVFHWGYETIVYTHLIKYYSTLLHYACMITCHKKHTESQHIWCSVLSCHPSIKVQNNIYLTWLSYPKSKELQETMWHMRIVSKVSLAFWDMPHLEYISTMFLCNNPGCLAAIHVTIFITRSLRIPCDFSITN